MNYLRILTIFLRLTVAVAITIYIVTSINLNKAYEIVGQVKLVWLLVAFAFIVLIKILMTFRWQYILSQNQVITTFIQLFRITIISNSFGQILPGGVGTDIVRGYQLARQSKNRIGAEIVSTIMVDRLIGIFAMLFIAFIGSIIGYFFYGLFWQLSVILLTLNLTLVLTWFLFSSFYSRLSTDELNGHTIWSTLKKKLNLIITAITDKKGVAVTFPTIFILSVIIQLTRCIVFYVIYISMGCKISYIYFLTFIPILFIIMFVPISIAGLGIREAFLVLMFESLNVSPEISVSAGILSHLLQILVVLLGLVLWFFSRNEPNVSIRSEANVIHG